MKLKEFGYFLGGSLFAGMIWFMFHFWYTNVLWLALLVTLCFFTTFVVSIYGMINAIWYLIRTLYEKYTKEE